MTELFDIIGDISNILGITSAIISAITSVVIWRNLRKDKNFNEQRISIRLKFTQMVITLPFAIERKNLARSELLGLLGMLPMKRDGARYSLAFTNTREFFDLLKAAQDEKDVHSIEIQCTDKELEQFDVPKMRQQCDIKDTNNKMTTYFVSRHPGAKEWATAQGFAVDVMLEHLDLSILHPGDKVLGSLPVNLVAELNAIGVRYFHLTLSLPPELRGQELSATLMQQLGARLEEHEVRRKTNSP